MRIFRKAQSPEVEFDPTFRFETSWILPPVALFAVRALLSLYAFVTTFTIYGYNGSHGRPDESEHSFSYFTDLTFWGLAFYMAFSAVHTYSYWLRGRPYLAAWPRALQEAHSMFYSTIVVFPWMVTIVYWALLYSEFRTPFQTWTNTSQHALNAACALFEIIFPRTAPPRFLHIITLIVILGLYLGLAYVTYATDNFFVYDFLDTRTNSPGKVAGYIVGIGIGTVIIFLIVRYLIVFRIWVTEKKLGKRGKTTSRGERGYVRDDAEKNAVVEDNRVG
jgi:hypothetical protein